ncbi:SRPBCC domain-containing protein [Puia sp.]|uniref:SRPBCC domain-containing protein n=1 Tax=Puia sp. TaxID=2045100 RepID=UPI002F422CF1
MSTTRTSRLIKATPDIIYGAFTEPAALEAWMAPGNMTGKVQSFEGAVGGGYVMSLYYPKDHTGPGGKTNATEDRYTARFITLQPYKKIVMAIRFDSGSPGFVGEMIMEVQLERQGSSTLVTIIFTNVPLGVRPEDNEKGTEQSLDKLEQYIQSK